MMVSVLSSDADNVQELIRDQHPRPRTWRGTVSLPSDIRSASILSALKIGSRLICFYSRVMYSDFQLNLGSICSVVGEE